jgi:hypothetical protein
VLLRIAYNPGCRAMAVVIYLNPAVHVLATARLKLATKSNLSGF